MCSIPKKSKGDKKMDQETKEFLEKLLESLNARFDGMENKFHGLNTKVSGIDNKVGGLEEGQKENREILNALKHNQEVTAQYSIHENRYELYER